MQRRDAAALAAGAWVVVPARRSGFIQEVDAEALLAFARKHNAIVRMERAIGEFVIEAQPLIAVAGAAVDDAGRKRLIRPSRSTANAAFSRTRRSASGRSSTLR